MVVYTDERGLLRREPIGEFLAILPPDLPAASRAPDPDAALYAVTLVDRQRYLGTPLDAGDRDEPPLLLDAGFARLEVPLEHVSSLARTGARPPARTASLTQDVIELANADRLEGFILTLGEVCRIETADAILDLPVDRLAWARLANPALPPPPTLLWLEDGTIAGVELLGQRDAASIDARLVPPGGAEPSLSDAEAPRLSILLARVRAASLNAASLIPLSSLTPHATTSNRPWTPAIHIADQDAAPLHAADITLPAPMGVTWVLPPDAARLAFEAFLPERSRVWGDADLVVVLEQENGTVELARHRLHADQPRVRINVELAAPADPRRTRFLRIELAEGPSGPAQDAAVLRRPLILLGSD